jgi:hypothetical protein
VDHQRAVCAADEYVNMAASSRNAILSYLNKYADLFKAIQDCDMDSENYCSVKSTMAFMNGPFTSVNGLKWDFSQFPSYELFRRDYLNSMLGIVVVPEAQGELWNHV